MLAMLALVVRGCVGELRIDSQTTIDNSSGGGQLTLRVTGTGLVNQVLKDGNLDPYISEDAVAEMSVQRYIENDQAVLKIGGEFSSLDDLNALHRQSFSSLGIVPTIARVQRRGFLRTVTSYEILFEQPDEASGDSVSSASEETERMTPDVILTYSLSVPGKVVSTNAVVRDGKVLTWTLSAGQMASNSVLSVTTQQGHPLRILGLAAIGALAALVIRQRVS